MKPLPSTARAHYRTYLTRVIEKHALENRLTFHAAAKAITTHKDMFEVVVMAMGNHWKAKPLTNAMIRGLRDKAKLKLARSYPDLSEDLLVVAAPYLKVKQRPKPLSNTDEEKHYVETLGSYKLAAEILGISVPTLYRRVPVHGDHSWHEKALELYLSPEQPPMREIARRLGVSYRKVRYYLQTKSHQFSTTEAISDKSI